jgi:putative transposase
LVKTHLLHSQDTYILAGDEVVVTKAGDETHGLNRFFSSLFGKAVPGLAFFAFALVNVQQRTAHPLRMGQVLRPETSAEVPPAPAPPAEKRGPGRPKGSQNRNKADVALSPYLSFIQTLLQAVLTAIGTTLIISYVVLDGAFGNNYALQMVRRCPLHLISKLAVNSALYFVYDGPYSGRGPRRKYGERVKYGQLPAKYLKRTSTEKGIRTEIYQFNALHKLFAQTLNVVIIVKTNTQTGAWAHAILFSSDLAQTYDQIIEYYTVRFQIEFVFRDAKQYWGLEDFMNIKETPVTNAANLAFFMVNVAQILRRQMRPSQPDFSVLDLKAHFRGLKYVAETLKLLPQTPDPIVIQQIAAKVALIGAVNAT